MPCRIMDRTSGAPWPAFVLVGLLYSTIAEAAVPSGATASLSALRQAYVDAVASRNTSALEALFDTTLMSPGARTGFRRHIGQDFGHQISSAVLTDSKPGLNAEYAQYHVHFSQPVIKSLKVTFVAPAGQADGSEYFIGTEAGRFFFISAVPDGK